MGRFRRLIRGGLEQVSRVVTRNNLFEKPGERAPTPPLPPRDTSRRAMPDVAPAPSATDRAPSPPAEPLEPPVAAVEPAAEPAGASVQAAVPAASEGADAGPARPTGSELDALLAPTPDGVAVVDLARLQHLLGPGCGVRVVNHWASWCIPCVEEFDTLKAVHARLPSGVRFFGVSWDLFDPRGDEDDIADHVANFAGGHHLPWPSVLIGEAVEAPTFFSTFGLSNQTIPQTWVIDGAGTVVLRIDGTLTEAHIDPVLAAVRQATSGEG